MNEELRKIDNKVKTISIKNDTLNDFLSGMVDKRLIWMLGSFFTRHHIKIVNSNSCAK